MLLVQAVPKRATLLEPRPDAREMASLRQPPASGLGDFSLTQKLVAALGSSGAAACVQHRFAAGVARLMRGPACRCLFARAPPCALLTLLAEATGLQPLEPSTPKTAIPRGRAGTTPTALVEPPTITTTIVPAAATPLSSPIATPAVATATVVSAAAKPAVATIPAPELEAAATTADDNLCDPHLRLACLPRWQCDRAAGKSKAGIDTHLALNDGSGRVPR